MKRAALAFGWALTALTISHASAATLESGCDCYITESPGTQISIPNLPALFPGCTVLAPLGPDYIVQMQGEPLSPPYPGPCDNAELTWINPHGTPVSPDDNHKVGQTRPTPVGVDTVVCRTDSGSFASPGSADDIPIELVSLSLTSVGCPISVNCPGAQSWRVNATSDGAQSAGSAHFVASSVTPAVTGNVDLTSLPVNFKLDFERCDLAGTRGPFTGLSITFLNGSGNPDGTFAAPDPGATVPGMNRWLELVLAGLLLGLTSWFLIARRRGVSRGAA